MTYIPEKKHFRKLPNPLIGTIGINCTVCNIPAHYTNTSYLLDQGSTLEGLKGRIKLCEKHFDTYFTELDDTYIVGILKERYALHNGT